jgi:hypothetical protein
MDLLALTNPQVGCNVRYSGIFHAGLYHFGNLGIDPATQFSHCRGHVLIRKHASLSGVHDVVLQISDLEKHHTISGF